MQEKVTIQKTNQKNEVKPNEHNRDKKKYIKANAPFLKSLSISDDKGKVTFRRWDVDQEDSSELLDDKSKEES